MRTIIIGLLITSSMSGMASPSVTGSEKFYVNQVKLVNLFKQKLIQPINLRDFAGEWLKPVRSDAIYPGACHPVLIFKDPHIERRAEFNLEVDSEAYAYEGGPALDIASRMIGRKSLILDLQNNVGSATFKGSLVIWSKKYNGASKHCVVVKPSEVS